MRVPLFVRVFGLIVVNESILTEFCGISNEIRVFESHFPDGVPPRCLERPFLIRNIARTRIVFSATRKIYEVIAPHAATR